MSGFEIRVPEHLRVVGPSGADDGLSAGVSIDQLDYQILVGLVEDSRVSNRALAARVGLTEVTVAARIRRMIADRVLIFTALLDWAVAGYEWVAIVRTAVAGRQPAEVARDLATIRGCQASSVVSGAADVLATFLVPDRRELHHLKTVELAAVAGIEKLTLDVATETYMTPGGRSAFFAQRDSNLWLPAPRVSLDAVDIGVIEALIADGRTSSRRIGRALGVSEGTVRARKARLEQAGLLRVVAMLNPLAFGMIGAIAAAALQVRSDAIAAVIERLRRIPEIAHVMVTLGSVDLMVGAAATTRDELLDTVLAQVRDLAGVRSLEVFELVEPVHGDPFFKRFDDTPL